jgi:hypothetical protein
MTCLSENPLTSIAPHLQVAEHVPHPLHKTSFTAARFTVMPRAAVSCTSTAL